MRQVLIQAVEATLARFAKLERQQLSQEEHQVIKDRDGLSRRLQNAPKRSPEALTRQAIYDDHL